MPEITPFLFEADSKNINTFSDNQPLVNGEKLPAKSKGKFKSTAQGKIWLMPARGRESKKDPTAIDWKRLYSEMNGFLLMEELKARIHQKTGADYLLIDSRTGLSDHSLICTNQLADALAVIYFPNIQNLEGLKGVMGDLREHGGVEEENIRFVASRIPVGDDEDEILSGMLKNFRSELKIVHPELRLHQNASFSLLQQEIFSLQRTRNTQLFRDYMKLTTEIESLNVKSKRGTLEFLERNIYRLEEGALNEANKETRQKVIHRLNVAGQSFLDSVAINFSVSRSLKSLSGTIWEGELSGVREKAFLHFFMGLILSQMYEEYKESTTTAELKKLAISLIYMLLLSDYSFEQMEDLSITGLLQEQYGLGGHGFELEEENMILASINEAPASKMLDKVSDLLIPEDAETLDIHGPTDFYIVLILWRHRHSISSKELMFSKLDYEIFNETAVRKAKRVIDRFYATEKYQRLKDMFYVFSELSQTDIIDEDDLEYQKPLFDLIKEKGFSVDVSFEIRDTITKSIGVKQYLADYLCCICEFVEGAPGYAVVNFVDGRTDNHTDFGRCISRAIVYKIMDVKQGYQLAIGKAADLSEGIVKKYENFKIQGRGVDTYFSYLTLTRRPIEDAKAELEFITNKTGAEILSELKKFAK